MAKALTRYDELAVIVDSIAASYAGDHEIDSLQSAALPNRRAVIEALNHLKPLIYLGFYSTRPLNRGNLRYAISEHLHPAFETLVEQIRRAVEYEHACCRSTLPNDPDWSEGVVLRLFNKLPELRSYLNDDVVAAFAGDP